MVIPVVRFAHVACANTVLVVIFPASFQLRMFSSRELCLCRGKKCLPPEQFGKRNTKYLWLTCVKSVCVRVECSIAEEKEDTLGWGAKRLPAVCWSCCRLPMKLNQLLWKMNLWTTSVSITSNQFVHELACDWNNRRSINTLEQEPFLQHN